MSRIDRVVHLNPPHRHKSKGDEDMQQPFDERPVFVQKIGNTTIKIRSILPFMTSEERAQWFKDNADLPEVKQLHMAMARALWALEEQEARKKDSQGA